MKLRQNAFLIAILVITFGRHATSSAVAAGTVVDELKVTIREWDVPTPHSRPHDPAAGPHGLVADREGNIWYTGNFEALISKLNPKTGEVTEYKIPDARARDPHTPVFDRPCFR